MKRYILLFFTLAIFLICHSICIAGKTPVRKCGITLVYDTLTLQSASDTTFVLTKSQLDNLMLIANGKGDTTEIKVNSLSSCIETLQSTLSDYNRRNRVQNIAIIILFTGLLTMLALILVNRKRLKSFIINTIIDSYRLEQWRDSKLTQYVHQFKSEQMNKKDFEECLSDIKQRLQQLENEKQKGAYREQGTVSEDNGQKDDSNSIFLYAASIVDNTFQIVTKKPDSDTVFKLTLRGHNKASFTIYENANSKVLANPSFLEGCKKTILGSSRVVVTKEGVAFKESGGRWRVDSTLDVELR